MSSRSNWVARSAARRGLGSSLASFVVLTVFAVACSTKEEPAGASHSAAKGARPPVSFVLQNEPPGAQPVKEVLQKAKDGEEVVAIGRVGEEIKGRAAFRLVDASLKACSEMEMPDACTTPWDYCCTPPEELRKVAASVELRQGGSALEADLLGWNGFDHLKTVVVQGRVERDSSGNITIAASGVFVRK
ncbi:MAG TPA: hypothetical protein VFG37_15105 [Planctomycetota bacterium]|nr:hypothetical protein [Planctomycetota bacterium]